MLSPETHSGPPPPLPTLAQMSVPPPALLSPPPPKSTGPVGTSRTSKPPQSLALVYEPDQWSPLNQTGARRYTRQQLLLLRMQPQSQIVPKCKSKFGVLARINLMPAFAKKSMMHPHEQHQHQQHQQQRQRQQSGQHHQQLQQQQGQQQGQQQHGGGGCGGGGGAYHSQQHQQQQQHHHHQQQHQHQQQHGNPNHYQQQQQHGANSGNASTTSGGGGGGNNQIGKKNQRHQNRGSGGGGGGGAGGANSGSNKNKSNESKDSKPEVMHISLTTAEDVKLNETENAWKPRVILAAEQTVPSMPPDQCDELYKKVRSILNKLTFDNFDVLLEQLKNFDIDSMEKLNGVILLVFDKAIDEPKFSRAYAQLCRSLVENCFPVDSGSRKLFKTTLINKCQREFERNVTGAEGNAETMRPMREELLACGQADRRAELTALLVETEQRLRRRTVCTVGFIGELYRMEMLTTKIINWCVRALLDSRSEEKLECLCKLLATVGEKIETKTGDEKLDEKNYVDLSEYFRQLQQIVERKGAKKVSNRVRFMLQDIIDLRLNNWVSRRK